MSSSLLMNVFLVGLVSTLHCSTMCGGIMGALSLSLPREIKDRSARFLSFIVLYNLGRLFSYAAMGALIGGIGGRFYGLVPPEYAHLLFQASIAVVSVAVGLHLVGMLPRLSAIEAMGAPVWRCVEPLGRRLLPVTRPYQALLYGAVWGWMPCGLVYAVLFLALTSGSAEMGGIVMAAFWLGSLPTLLAAGMLARSLTRMVRMPKLRFGLGLCLIGLGFTSVLAGYAMPNEICFVCVGP